MSEACTLYVPLRMFPSSDQLAPLCPDARVGVDGAGATALVEWPGVRVRLSRMPEQDLGRHLDGFIGWARSAGGTEALAIRILHTLAVWGAVIEPEADLERRAFQFLTRLNGAADGLLFTGGEIYDAGGTALLRSGGPLPPDAERVARQALALLAISVRGLLEDDVGRPDHARADGLREDLVTWLRSRDLWEQLEDDERALLEAPLGTPTRQAIVDAVWRAEGAQLLLWALGARPLPAHDAQEHPYEVARDAGVLGKTLPPLLASPRLRSPEEMEAQRRKLLGIHWRLRQLQHRPGNVDFRAFAARNWFGGFSLEGIALAGDDLSLRDVPAGQAEPGVVNLASSIAAERHQAANWLLGVHRTYSRVGTPT